VVQEGRIRFVVSLSERFAVFLCSINHQCWHQLTNGCWGKQTYRYNLCKLG